MSQTEYVLWHTCMKFSKNKISERKKTLRQGKMLWNNFFVLREDVSLRKCFLIGLVKELTDQQLDRKKLDRKSKRRGCWEEKHGHGVARSCTEKQDEGNVL